MSYQLSNLLFDIDNMPGDKSAMGIRVSRSSILDAERDDREMLLVPVNLCAHHLHAQKGSVVAQERESRQQQQSRAEALAAEAAAAKGEIAALKTLKSTLTEQVLANEAQVTNCSSSVR